MVVLYLLPCLANRVDVVVVVVMDWHCTHDLMRVVLVAVEVLLRWLSVPVVALLDTGLDSAVEIVLWRLGGSLQARQVVLRYLRTVVLISGGGIPWCSR